MHRRTVIILVVALLQAPLCFLPSLHSLTRASLLATLGAIGFVVATVALSVAASAEGIVPPLHVMPDKALLGAGSGGGFGRVAMGVLQSLPVSLTAYGNQYNVHPVMAELRPGRGGVLVSYR